MGQTQISSACGAGAHHADGQGAHRSRHRLVKRVGGVACRCRREWQPAKETAGRGHHQRDHLAAMS